MDGKEFYSNLGAFKYFSSEFQYSTELSRKLRSLVFQFDFPKNGTLVDLGCGPGINFLPFWERGSFTECLAVDYSEDMLNFFKDGVASVDPRIRFQKADLEVDQIEIRNSMSNLVISQSVLLYLQKIDNLFVESSRVLMRGGVMAFNVFTHNGEEKPLLWSESACPADTYFHSELNIERQARVNNMEIKERKVIKYANIDGLGIDRALYVLQKI